MGKGGTYLDIRMARLTELSKQLGWLRHKAQSGKKKDLDKLKHWKRKNLNLYERLQKEVERLREHYSEWGI
jgi:predicted  nucleic acid-binding Zn-ribbon protein